MAISAPRAAALRVALYGCGRFANQTHLPNLQKLPGATVVALCDADAQALATTGDAFGIPARYTDAQAMLEREPIDLLYSIVPAYVRTNVELAAVARGIHLFSEKPQALTMTLARQIDDAIRQHGVISTVGFRERYRPLFQQARQWLADKTVTHVRFISVGTLPTPQTDWRGAWWTDLNRSGGAALDWGVHATDYVRFMTGLNVGQAQAFYHQTAAYTLPLAYSFHYGLSNGASMTMTFLNTTPVRPPNEPWFTIFYEGGYLALHGYERLEANGETIYTAEPFDPWFEQSRCFIEAVRTQDPSLLQSDYHDSLSSLGPVLAGWASARQGGQVVDVAAFMQEN
ncbi:MAG: Gfo/Idh/MocA family oxidoreductase [Caldilineaceae bacterium]|nr:Gfo/Idh/MocA family oxidoreductase [Caldilineaceae bacterium]